VALNALRGNKGLTSAMLAECEPVFNDLAEGIGQKSGGACERR